MALVLALAVLVVLSATSVAVIDYTSTNSRSASHSKEKGKAFVLAEAGINNAMSVLLKPSNNALDPCLLRPQPQDPDCAIVHGAGYAPFVNQYEGGTVTWYGVLNQAAAVWTLTSTGKMRNPTGRGEVIRTLTARVPVVPTNTQPANNPSWNYIMSTGTGDLDGCDMEIGNTVEVRTNLYVFGNLCFLNQGKMLRPASGALITLVVNGALWLKMNDNTVGTSTAPIAEAHIKIGCRYLSSGQSHWHPAGDGHPFCSSVDRVYATALDQTAGTLSTPVADFNKWWRNASPGPFIPCETGGPITFDTNQGTTTGPDRSVTTVYNLMPTTSYSCSTLGGELSWNASTNVLTVRGTIFFDGHVRAEPQNSGAVIDYEGTATLYAYGSIAMKNVKVCGAVSGSTCNFSGWNPNTTMLSLVSGGNGGQPDVDAGESISLKNAHFQGSLYATNKVSIDTSSRVDGPMIGSEVILGQAVSTDDFPTITTVPAGMPGAPTVYAQSNPPEMFSG